ncbi:hypothetical protein [Microvirga sp. VF16]|uniref:hypothetical protein n=1 Tax=Microvirga sp. VF16 TaxID=2807101 RepID=UPI00193E3B7A|nr:hypothetical protein [Microvirga sp. VF16]QRM31293.1 hypothetical protein JO965_10040 [Microvirga sp. VF16]
MSRGDAEMLFEHAPPLGLQRRLGLLGSDDLAFRRRALMVILAAWMPLLVLAVLQSAWARVDLITPVLREVGLHTRYLIAAPLLVLAEATCVPQLNAIVRHISDGGFADERDRGRLDEAIASTRRLLRSRAAEICVFVLAYLIVLATILSRPLDQLPVWAQPVGGMPRYSLAGWWHMLVSLPLLLALILGWLWRLALWTRLLWHVSRLKLRLVASHPDRRAGLSFLGLSVRALAAVGLALAIIPAGRSANVVLGGSVLPTPHIVFNVALLLAIAALFIAPLLVFTPTLMRTWRQGALAHDALAERIGHAFEHRWLARKAEEDARDPSDFSAVADLYAVVENVHAIRLVPVGLKDLLALAVALLLPFVPVLLLAVPRDVIWAHISSLLF